MVKLFIVMVMVGCFLSELGAQQMSEEIEYEEAMVEVEEEGLEEKTYERDRYGRDKHNYTCQFMMEDNEEYDLSVLQRKAPPDYTIKTDRSLYRVNFCGTTHRVCNGTKQGMVQKWTKSTFVCQEILTEGNAVATYLKKNQPWAGIMLTYPNGLECGPKSGKTKIKLACEYEYDNVILRKVEESPSDCEFVLHFATKHACRNYAKEIQTNKFSLFAKFLLGLLLVLLIYHIVGALVNMKRNSYDSFSQSIPHKETWMSCAFQLKQMFKNFSQFFRRTPKYETVHQESSPTGTFN